MKRLLIILIVLLPLRALACTNLIVGKKASADGSVFISYNADSYGTYGNLYHHIGSTHEAGEMRPIYEWDTNKYLGEIPQAERTYTVVSQMNEHQVAICETTFGGRHELADSTGILDYGSLIYIALERSRSASEAIDVMTSLVEKYGYYSEGESFSIADPNEAWIMEMVGRGPGGGGALWVAVRIPDDCISAHANQSRITTFDRKDKDNVRYAKDVIKFAREKGYFSGKDEDFSFRDAYCPLDFSGIRICDARVWSFFRRHADGMDAYLPYLNGEGLVEGGSVEEMPLYVKPNHLLSVRDVQNGMRDHYEDTPLDIRNDLGAGAYHMPYRPTPLGTKVDSVRYYNERPTSTQQTSFSIVCQLRADKPDAIGGVAWWMHDDANMGAYTPVYCASTTVPPCYQRVPGVRDELTFSWESAFWLTNMVANMVYPYYDKMFPDLQRVRDGLEDRFAARQDSIETLAASLPAEEGVALLTQYGLACADEMMQAWKDLFVYLVVKHNDMTIKQEEDGHFKRTPYGLAAPVQRPGYPEDYWRAIIRQTGDRYVDK